MTAQQACDAHEPRLQSETADGIQRVLVDLEKLREANRVEDFPDVGLEADEAQIAAVLAERTFLKIVRFLPFTDPRIQSGQMPEFSRETFRAILPIVTR